MSMTKSFSVATKYQAEIERILGLIDSRDASRFICMAIIEKAQKMTDIERFGEDDSYFVNKSRAENKETAPVEKTHSSDFQNQTKESQNESIEKTSNTPKNDNNPLVQKVMDIIREKPMSVVESPEILKAIENGEMMALAKFISTHSTPSTPSIQETPEESSEKASTLKNLVKDW